MPSQGKTGAVDRARGADPNLRARLENQAAKLDQRSNALDA
jgi:hypothetical protein